MSASGGVQDFSNVVMRPPNVAHLSPANFLQHPISNNTTPLQYGSWETRESSPLSDTQSHLMKESMERTLNFSTSPHDDEYGYGKKKTAPRVRTKYHSST
jgi:hypothetical protein